MFFVRIGGCCLVLLASGLAAAAPGARLGAAGFSTDPGALPGYLREGFPAPTQAQARPGTRLPGADLALYVDAANLLRDTRPPGAAPVLLARMTDPLPEAILEDVLIRTLAETEGGWEDWDRGVAHAEMALRWSSAEALAAMEPDAVMGPLVRLVREEQEAVRAAMQHDRDNAAFVGHYAQLCAAAAQLGAPEGVGALIGLLAHTPPAHRHTITRALWRALGAAYPLSEAMPEAAWQAGVRDWEAWWAKNAEHITPPLSGDALPPPVQQPETLRGWLRLAAMDPQLMSGVPTARQWLAQNARRERRNLRQVAEDAQEGMAIRELAADLYVREAGRAGLRWLRGSLTHAGSARDTLSPEFLLGLVRAHHPQTLDAVTRAAIAERSPAAPAAVRLLLAGQPPEANRLLVLEHYAALVRQFPVLRDVIEVYRQWPTPGDEIILSDAFVRGSRATAVEAGAAVRQRGNEMALSTEAQQALARWREDPMFQLDVLAFEADAARRHDEAAAIVRDLRGEEEEVARLYARAYRHMTRDFEHAPSAAALEVLASFRDSLVSYKISRGYQHMGVRTLAPVTLQRN